jgi:RNA polymerase sigma-70 factor (ECF subfamily)
MPLLSSKTFQEADSKKLNEQEFERLFEDYWQPIYQVMHRLTGDNDDAEDLALETFLRLWNHPPRDTSNPGGWLYRVAMNLGYNALRASKRRQQYENTAGRDALINQSPPDPQDEVEQTEMNDHVRLILGEMLPRDAKLLILRYSGLSYKEIAAVLQVPVSSIGKMLYRAEEKFENLFTRNESSSCT